MPVIEDPLGLPERRGTAYPAEHAAGLEGRIKRVLGDRLGLSQFGVNLTTLEPGAKSSQRHWHESEDEFIYVLSGEITLVTDEGERVLRASMAAGFPRGESNGHQLVNKGNAPAIYLEIGTRASEDRVVYPDIDMKGEKRNGVYSFTRKSGEPFA